MVSSLGYIVMSLFGYVSFELVVFRVGIQLKGKGDFAFALKGLFPKAFNILRVPAILEVQRGAKGRSVKMLSEFELRQKDLNNF